MHEYFVDDNMARLTIMIGIVVSTILYKRTGRTLGGVIVCGYLALFITHPLHILVTLLIAYLTYQIVHNVLKKRYMLNGRKLFEVEILVGLLIQVSWLIVIRAFNQADIDLAAFYGIGFVIPGVMAHDMGRQTPRNALTSIFMGVFIVSLIVIPLSAFEQLIPDFGQTLTLPIFHTDPNPYTYPLYLLPIGIVVSVLIDLWAYAKFGARSGGFVTAAYLALFAFRPLDLLFVVVASIITYLFVRFVTARVVLAFGRTKLGMMILSGVVISWGLEILVIQLTQGMFVPWSGFVVIMPTIASLIANDFDRQGPQRTLITTGLSAAGVFLVMQVVVYVISLAHLNWLALS
jgi:poly-gamma-glutamate biosynthesis protein PgsC/CapC